MKCSRATRGEVQSDCLIHRFWKVGGVASELHTPMDGVEIHSSAGSRFFWVIFLWDVGLQASACSLYELLVCFRPLALDEGLASDKTTHIGG